jgi:hypothetical protein
VELADELSVRDREIAETVGRLKLLTGLQVQRLYFADGANQATRARLARRALARLVERGVLARLQRRVGGVRAGAAGHTYFLAAGGQRLVAYWRGEGLGRTRSAYEPTGALVRHTLAVSDAYVRCVEAARDGVAVLLDFVAEPGCWERFTARTGETVTLKPDARVILGLDGGDEESHAWLEIDCSTEGRRALERKCRAYLAAYHAGIDREVFPRVVWVPITMQRAELLREVFASMPTETWKLFTVTIPDHLLDVLTETEGPS